MTSTDESRRYRRDRIGRTPNSLTVGDGFRVGIGIAFWLFAFTLAFYVLVFVLMVGAGLVGRG